MFIVLQHPVQNLILNSAKKKHIINYGRNNFTLFKYSKAFLLYFPFTVIRIDLFSFSPLFLRVISFLEANFHVILPLLLPIRSVLLRFSSLMVLSSPFLFSSRYLQTISGLALEALSYYIPNASFLDFEVT